MISYISLKDIHIYFSFSFSPLLAKTIHIALAIIFIALIYDLELVDGSSGKIIIDGPLLTEKIGSNHTILVDINGDGHFKSVQAAVDSVPEGNSHWVVIHIRKGVYREKVHIPENKPFIFMRGNGIGRTSIVWSQSSTKNAESATFTADAPKFHRFRHKLQVQNIAPIGMPQTSQNQSVAMFVSSDKVAFYHCGFFSNHNTLFDHKGRHYYESCYIQGSLDFIFGAARSTFYSTEGWPEELQDCEVFVIADWREGIDGSITAHNKQTAEEDTGFVFVKGKVYGTGEVYLGRAKGAYSKVIFAETYLSMTITRRGWTNWSYDGTTEHLYHAEYKCTGPGSYTGDRAPWAKQLGDEEAAQFLTVDFIDGKEWLPAWI
ncbi:Probable pectinesterase 67 [Ancistrocladus abbreviatus]